MLLPCRHIFFVRIKKSLSVFMPEMIPKRLRADLDIEKICIKAHQGSSHAQIENLNSLSAFENLNKNMDRKEKYDALFRPAQELCNTLKDLPMEQFKDKLSIFLYIKELFEKRIDFIPSILNSNTISELDIDSRTVELDLNDSDIQSNRDDSISKESALAMSNDDSHSGDFDMNSNHEDCSIVGANKTNILYLSKSSTSSSVLDSAEPTCSRWNTDDDSCITRVNKKKILIINH